MYAYILAIHNVLRWVILMLAFLSVAQAWRGWNGRRDWTPRDRKLGVIFSMMIDIQLLVGLLLYIFFSPITRWALNDFGAAMGVRELRYFAVEHVGLMILAALFAHLGSLLARKATSTMQKHRQAAIWFSLALLMILAGIPWWRPLLPGL